MRINFVTRLLADAEYETATGNFTRKDLPPGSAEWSSHGGDVNSLLFSCPCGCGAVRTVPVKRESNPAKAWSWNGDEANPTLIPSIKIVRDCNWHGFLTAGEWRSA